MRTSQDKEAYIEGLLKTLISVNKFNALYMRIGNNKVAFLKHAMLELQFGVVAKMNPETLGKIMGSFKIGDVLASKKEIFALASFNGDCEDFLREIVSICLAYAIYEDIEAYVSTFPPGNKVTF